MRYQRGSRSQRKVGRYSLGVSSTNTWATGLADSPSLKSVISCRPLIACIYFTVAKATNPSATRIDASSHHETDKNAICHRGVTPGLNKKT